jgi:hypothetical protein
VIALDKDIKMMMMGKDFTSASDGIGPGASFLKVLEKSLPPEVFCLLLERLPQFNQVHCNYEFIVNYD